MRLAVCLLVGMGIMSAGAASPRVGTLRSPLVSPRNPASPRDNADQPLHHAPQARSEGGNRVYFQLPPQLWEAAAAGRIWFYVAGPDGTGYQRCPSVNGVARLGRGEYSLAAVVRPEIGTPWRFSHLDYGPVRVTFPSKAGAKRYWRLLPPD